MITPGEPVRRSQRWKIPGVCIFLASIILLVFGQTVNHEFINYDDNLYVYANPLVTAGLTLQGVTRVFTHSEVHFYTPLTMISHMANCQFFGLWAGGHHLTNLLLHTTTVILLFLVLLQMTGALWRSAFVAAVFAIHPLHVESVAWVAERNDVLGGLFFVLTIGAYVRYVRSVRSFAGYLPVLFFFILGLLSKPTLVALPFVLLLLDYWPMNRCSQSAGETNKTASLPQLLLEKIPLITLSLAACVAAYFAEGKSVASLQVFSFSSRLANALVSCVIYLRQMIWPADLSIFYPHPAGGLPPWEVGLALFVLAVISAGAIAMRRRCPYLLMGWLWYLGILVPVIGLIQVGEFAHADRYTYLSQIGLYLAMAWGAVDLCGYLRLPRILPGIAALLVTGALIFCACEQVSYWRDSETIFRHALDCTTDNYLACNNLGSALYQKGHADEAIAIYEKGLEFRPASAPLNDNLGMALFQKGQVNEAISHYKTALQTDPGSALAHYNLGNALIQNGDVRGAITQWQRSLEIQPQYFEAEASIAWVLATCADDSLRNGPRAVELALQANQFSGDTNPIVLRTLAAAFAETGHFSEATDAARRALQLADAQGNLSLVAALSREILFYEAGTPLRAGGR
jgi:tetratricopeptide (TPR) repeat protein